MGLWFRVSNLKNIRLAHGNLSMIVKGCFGGGGGAAVESKVCILKPTVDTSPFTLDRRVQ